VRSILVPGRVNAMAQKLVALTVPGVPDLYQGSELWSLDLVDPDNRRPVDYGLRRALLDDVCGDLADVAKSLDDQDDPGLAKLLVVQRALDVRRRHEPAFSGPGASYTTLIVDGVAADHVVAFARGEGVDAVITVVPRLSRRLELDGGWRDTSVQVPDGAWRDVISGEQLSGGPVALSALTAAFPVALLERA
jgi:(1->4)-alpha-D-glucan 1-alpha-D-glucosylmutase